jgi:hypothetical protein
MAGWETIQKIRELEKRVDQLGLKFAKYPHGDWTENHNALSLVPKDANSLPIYNRDASIYAGSLEGVEHWLRGVEWAREYDRMVVDKNIEKKRERKEQDERNRQLLKTIKDSKLATGIKNV